MEKDECELDADEDSHDEKKSRGLKKRQQPDKLMERRLTEIDQADPGTDIP